MYPQNFVAPKEYAFADELGHIAGHKNKLLTIFTLSNTGISKTVT